MNDLSTEFYLSLGQKLRDVRRTAGLQQPAVAREMGFKLNTGQVFLSRLEHGKAANVTFGVVVRYLQACKAPVGKFMLELAQSGAFGEIEQGLTIVEDKAKADEAKRAKAKLLRDKRWEREAQDADIVAKLWREVQAAIRPLLPNDPTIFLSHYLEGVRTFYRAWKQVVRGTTRLDTELQLAMSFDRIEQAGLEARLVPAAVHKMREMMFDRLMQMTPQGGIT
jgi:transcriptional regulator with XRE-family HTH domain